MTVTISELKEKFGPTLDVAPYGECIVIQGTKFDPDWEAELGDLGYACHFGSLDGHAVTFVQLKKAVAPGKVVYVPPAASKTVHGNEVKKLENQIEEKKEVTKFRGCQKSASWEKPDEERLMKRFNEVTAPTAIDKIRLILPEFPGRNLNSLNQKVKKLKKRAKGEVAAVPQVEKVVDVQDPLGARAVGGNMWGRLWDLKEDVLLVDLWNRQPRLIVKDMYAEFKSKFPERSFDSVGNRVSRLQQDGRIQPRFKMKRKGAKVANDTSAIPALKSEKSIEVPGTLSVTDKARGPEVEPEVKVDFELALVNLALETKRQIDQLTEVINLQSRAHAELKEDFEAYAKMQSEIVEAHREDLRVLTAKCATLHNNIAVHKHAVSGEAMLPMEGTS